MQKRIKEVIKTVFMFDGVEYDSIEKANSAMLKKDICDKIIELTESKSKHTDLDMDCDDLANFLVYNKNAFLRIFNLSDVDVPF